jgi:hypothetical protein
MTTKRWQEIHGLAEVARLAEETRVAQWQRREAEIEAAIARLDQGAAYDPLADTPLRRAGADLRWEIWCDARRTALLAELAQVRYRKAAATETMRHAARRTIATEAVLSEERKADARLRASRAEREGRG